MNSVVFIISVVFPILLIIGLPIYAALGITGFLSVIITNISLEFATQSILNSLDNFPLLAIPAFILAGNIMEAGGITQDIINIFRRMLGRIHGSLGIVTIFSCMFFASISGSGPGTVAAIGAILIPSMIKYGYPAPYAAATSATGGTLGIMIPPSNPMIIYAIIANVSIADMFIAGIIPGIITGFVLALVAYIIARKKNLAMTVDLDDEPTTLKGLFWKAKYALFLPILILGGIYVGIFTPVEASVVAVVYALLIATCLYRSLSWQGLLKAFDSTIKISGALMIVVACSTLFARMITLEQIPQELAQAISSLTDSKLMLLLMINILLLIIGTFMETISAIIILAPILVPIIRSFGIDPIHFGIILIINIEIAFLTPPLGVNLFVASQIANISIEKIIKAIMPFVLSLIGLLIVYTLVPKLSIFLPSLLK